MSHSLQITKCNNDFYGLQLLNSNQVQSLLQNRSIRNQIVNQRCAGVGVQESTPEGVGVFRQESEQDQKWIFLIRTVSGAGVVFRRVF